MNKLLFSDWDCDTFTNKERTELYNLLGAEPAAAQVEETLANNRMAEADALDALQNNDELRTKAGLPALNPVPTPVNKTVLILKKIIELLELAAN